MKQDNLNMARLCVVILATVAFTVNAIKSMTDNNLIHIVVLLVMIYIVFTVGKDILDN